MKGDFKMMKEITMDEMMNVDGGGFWTDVATGAAAGAIKGGIAGSTVPGGGTVAGAIAGGVIGAGVGALKHAFGRVTP